jgi:ATP-dependent helicase/nuclease subunit A
MSLRVIPPETRRRQRVAADPAASVWVSAHAGSGKTYVLAQRVLRLLLDGAAPSKILCLTFTRAAAANMSARIFRRLAHWALLDDAALSAEIEATGATSPSIGDLAVARRLFARAVETPGGLKILTIHAFCEKLLHIFPFEANTPAGFRVLDDVGRAELLRHAKNRALQRAMRDPGPLRAALSFVAHETTTHTFDILCDELIDCRDALTDIDEPAEYERSLRRALGLAADDALALIEREIIYGDESPEQWPAIAQTLQESDKKSEKTMAGILMRAYRLAPHRDCIDEYISIFFTRDGAIREKLLTKDFAAAHPALLAWLENESVRLEPLIEKRKAAEIFERSRALALLGDAILSEYSLEKRRRNLLDYDDLIARVRGLLQRSSPSWILYKLDSQIDHILLDEAQDTSAAQWEILAAIADEFSAGEGARRIARSFFAVGDEKQSIFSFQGAAPEKFQEMRQDFMARFGAGGRRFESIELTLSFRSAPGILGAVDAVFAHEGNGAGLGRAGHGLLHQSVKTDAPALIEIWPLEGPSPTPEPTDWRLPLDSPERSEPAERVASRVAQKIAALLAPGSGETVDEDGRLRPPTAGDILILVRKRGLFFEAIIRALKAQGVKVAGADRLDLARHIAVDDLVALGQAALTPADDLTLACVLKSPLIGLDDDDLLVFAPDRPGLLYEALTQSSQPRHREAAIRFAQWRDDAATLAPFDFYSKVLSPDGGRARFVARLGVEAIDALDEFLRLALAFENDHGASLAAFLAMVSTLELSIKRDMETAGDAVRVMTAHAAKGLEAKIVFLPDSCGAPAGRHDPKLFASGVGGGGPLLWAAGAKRDPVAVAAARAAHRAAEQAEHQRLLYVALTRAEERLYIAGYHGVSGPAAGCWYEALHGALAPLCRVTPDFLDPDRTVLRLGDIPASERQVDARDTTLGVEIPAFARTLAPVETEAFPPLRPSSALSGADARTARDPTPTDRAGAARLRRGALMHALLQRLPACEESQRHDAARRFLDRAAPEIDVAERDAMTQSALSTIADPTLAPLFGPASVAEVDVAATLDHGLAVAGRIDRLAETPDAILIADFKTGRAHSRATLAELAKRADPAGSEAGGLAHIRQLALYRAAVARIYPGKRLRCFLIYVDAGITVEAPEGALDAALAREFAIACAARSSVS